MRVRVAGFHAAVPRAGEGEMDGVDAGGLDDASFFGDVAIEDSEATILTEGVGEVGDDQKRAR